MQIMQQFQTKPQAYYQIEIAATVNSKLKSEEIRNSRVNSVFN